MLIADNKFDSINHLSKKKKKFDFINDIKSLDAGGLSTCLCYLVVSLNVKVESIGFGFHIYVASYTG